MKRVGCRRSNNNCRAVLIIVKHRYSHPLTTNFFTIKKSDASIHSRLMSPNVGSSAQIISVSFSGSLSFTSMSKQSIFVNFLSKTALLSITGFEAKVPVFPKPNTADSLLITATRLPVRCNGWRQADLFIFFLKRPAHRLANMRGPSLGHWPAAWWRALLISPILENHVNLMRRGADFRRLDRSYPHPPILNLV